MRFILLAHDVAQYVVNVATSPTTGPGTFWSNRTTQASYVTRTERTNFSESSANFYPVNSVTFQKVVI